MTYRTTEGEWPRRIAANRGPQFEQGVLAVAEGQLPATEVRP